MLWSSLTALIEQSPRERPIYITGATIEGRNPTSSLKSTSWLTVRRKSHKAHWTKPLRGIGVVRIVIVIVSERVG